MSFKIGIIGHTGCGNYGHGLDMAFVGVDGADIVAVADPDETGRATVAAKAGTKTTYADYREMLEKEKPDIAVVASREVGDHRDYVVNTAAAGAHIYMEKPSAASPEQIDEMISACNKTSVQCVVAHPWRAHPPTQQVAIPLIKEGKIGEPRLARIYGMGGKHGGGQLFLDLYPHFFDLLWQLFGAPQWCHAHLTQDGRTCEPDDLFPADEGMGLTAGNGIRAYYCFDDGFAADFESYQGDGKENPYRIDFHGTEGTLSMPGPMVNSPDIYFHPLVNPGLIMDDRWQVVLSQPPPDDIKWVKAHHRSARSMMDMLEGKEPEWELVQLPHARNLLEMTFLAHASHMRGARASLPLTDGKNPFDHWS